MSRASRLIVVVVLALGFGCGRAQDRVRVLVIGIDGADWEAIERLWAEGRLPNLRGLAERGIATRLASSYGISPVIWTTMATGVAPDRHGIEGFVVPTERGDVPVSSALRRVPALWNMLSEEGLRVGVVSWWASWPAEEVDGVVVVSDRVVSGDRLAPVSGRVAPAALEERLQAWLEQALDSDQPDFERTGVGARDRLSATVGRHLLSAEDLDLAMIYLRGVDVYSHLHWSEFEPERFGMPEGDRLGADPVTAAYEASDQAIGLLMEAAGAEWDVLVVSDHGFVAMESEEARVQLDLDRLLDDLGLLVRDPQGAVDVASSSVYTYASRAGAEIKSLRFGGAAATGTRAELAAALHRVRWGDGARAFRMRDPRPRERRSGADVVVRVLRPGADERLLLDGEPVAGVVRSVTRQSGTHYRETPGVLFAAGPHVDPDAELEGVSIHDLTPTVLAAFGLPVAEDFAGVARRELFTESLRARRPPRTIPSWGERAGSAAPVTSSVDDEILEDLRALGYLDH
jgi:predicted AlkP superfamily phosphohydrolase/phosphomutase